MQCCQFTWYRATQLVGWHGSKKKNKSIIMAHARKTYNIFQSTYKYVNRCNWAKSLCMVPRRWLVCSCLKMKNNITQTKAKIRNWMTYSTIICCNAVTAIGMVPLNSLLDNRLLTKNKFHETVALKYRHTTFTSTINTQLHQQHTIYNSVISPLSPSQRIAPIVGQFEFIVTFFNSHFSDW